MDLKKDLKEFYAPTAKEVSFVTLPPMRYLMIDGKGNPNTAQVYVDAVTALYTVAYSIRAISKAAGEVFTVMPLEGLWWWEDSLSRGENFVLSQKDKDDFLWTMMILQPNHITEQMFEQGKESAYRNKGLEAIQEVRFEEYHEGDAAQILYFGAYADEGETIQRIHEAILAKSYQLRGKHHEIYLSDPRKVAPEKLKTIIRQPFVR